MADVCQNESVSLWPGSYDDASYVHAISLEPWKSFIHVVQNANQPYESTQKCEQEDFRGF